MGLVQNLFLGLGKKFRSQRKPNQLSFLQEKRLKHLPDNKINSLPYKNGQIWFKNAWEFMHSYEELITDEIYRFKADTDTPYIIDCGANIGLSVLYFKWLYPKAKVLAFEPDGDNLVILQKNVESYGMSDITVRQQAVWTKEGHISFQASGSQASKISLSDTPDTQTINIPCTRLASLLQQKVDFLKMDIEGAEYEVLKDCKDDLANVQHLFVEYHGDIRESSHLTEMLEILNNAGFVYYVQEASDNVPHPLLKHKQFHSFDQQLNIYAHRG